MWRIPVFLTAVAAGFVTVVFGSLWLAVATVMWLGIVALAVGMTGLTVATFRLLAWVF